MDVTGVPFADSGHHSAIPDTVAVPWDLHAEQDRLGTVPITILPTPTIRTRLPLGKGSGTSTCPPDLLVCTPALPPGGLGPSRAITTASPQGPLHTTTTPPAGHCKTAGAIFIGPRTMSRMTATRAAFPQCTSYIVQPLYSRFRGKRRLPRPYTRVRRPLLVTIKGGGGPPLSLSGL